MSKLTWYNGIDIERINNHCFTLHRMVTTGVGIDTVIYSYDNPVARIDSNNNLIRIWDGYSRTTIADINKATNNFFALNKAKWDAMEVE